MFLLRNYLEAAAGLDKTRRNLVNQLKAIVGQGPQIKR